MLNFLVDVWSSTALKAEALLSVDLLLGELAVVDNIVWTRYM